MRLQETPPENKRTRTDRLGSAPTLFWAMLAVIVVLVFIGLVLFLGHHPS